MSTPNRPETIPSPLVTRPDEIVVNVYPVPGIAAEPDLESAGLAEEFLHQRLVDDSGTGRRVGLGMTEWRVPVVGVTPGGDLHDVTRLRKAEGWFISKKVAAAVWLGSFALFNAHPISAAVQDVNHAVYRFIDPVGGIEKPIVAAGETITVNVAARSGDKVGDSSVNSAALYRFRTEVSEALAHGGVGSKIESITDHGGASDERVGDASIGVADPKGEGNNKLADERAVEAGDDVKAEFQGEDIPVIAETHSENVLSKKEKQHLEKAAKKAGFTNLYDAVQTLDAGKPMNAKLAKALTAAFVAKRGAKLSATIHVPGKAAVIGHRFIAGKDNSPPGPKGWKPYLIPLPFLRRRERYQAERPRWPRLAVVPGFRLPRLRFFKQNDENVLVRLRPEAEQVGGTLVDNPWAFDRKHEHEARDGLWNRILRADFKDSEDEDRAMRLTFVGMKPTAETERLYGEALKIFAASHATTKIDEIISGIFIYPSENAGINHRDPRRLNIGIDKQRPNPNVAGYCMPLLEVIEMHMPATQDPKELAEMFADYAVNRLRTLGHELGHGTDAIPEKQRLTPVRARGIRHGRVPDGDRWKTQMEPLEDVLHPLVMQDSPETPPLQFDVKYRVIDGQGRLGTVHTTVDANDGRLAHVDDAIIRGYQLTDYSAEHPGEHYADTVAANVAASVQNQLTPFTEAGVYVNSPVMENGMPGDFADGYKPDPRAQMVVTHAMGARAGVFPFEFEDAPDVSITSLAPEDDPLMREVMIRARSRRVLPPGEMVAILANVRR